ncbi:MAG: hypothetical protein U1F83_17160, partial [Verrucomicrobiota bacterium]
MRSKEVAKAAKLPSANREGFSVRFNLASLAVFSMALIVAAGGLAFILTHSLVVKANTPTTTFFPPPRSENDPAPAITPAWGELITYDIEIENPDEYMATDYDTNRVPMWILDHSTVERAKETLLACGLATDQVARALSPSAVTVTATNIVIRPEIELVLALSVEARGKLYALLARSPANPHMYYPACFPAKSFDLAMYESHVSPEVVAMIKPLLYQRGEAQYFSDFEVVMRRVPSIEERLLLLKALNRQPGVLARMRIRPTTDVDKLLGYWTQSPGVRAKDLRPLVDSLKRLPDGGTVSLVYFLPPFARERLYTFPMPPRAGEPAMDCHWSSLNFFSDQPEDRFGDPSYAGAYLSKNYYPVQKPS